MSRTVGLIQARMSSSRFRGKVLELLHGIPLIVYMVRRAARAQLLDDVVVVTSTDPTDDELEVALKTAGVRAFRGDLHDVLRRYVDAARSERATEVVRLTGDCPLIDPAIIDRVIALRRSSGSDYASNIDPPTYPDGLDVECFSWAALERADDLAGEQPEREHVTLWMRSKAAGLARANLRAVADFSHMRLTVDYPDDLVTVRRLLAAIGTANSEFDLFDMLRALDAEPDILSNVHARNEALAPKALQLGQS